MRSAENPPLSKFAACSLRSESEGNLAKFGYRRKGAHNDIVPGVGGAVLRLSSTLFHFPPPSSTVPHRPLLLLGHTSG